MKIKLGFILCALSLVFIFIAKNNSSDPYEYFTRASDLLEEGKYEKCIKASEKAAQFFKDFDAYENGENLYYDCLTIIGEAYLRAGETQKSLEQFEMTFDLAPQNENLLTGIAAVYFRLQKYSEGEAFFEGRIKRYMGEHNVTAPLYYFYACCLDSQGKSENAFYAAQVSAENYLKSGKNIPIEVSKLLDEISKKI